MNEFEFIYMMNELENTMSTHIMNFISIIFAMLVTAHFIGAKLNKIMAGAVVGLFSLGSALFCWAAITSRHDLLALARAAHISLQPDKAQVPSFFAFDAPDIVITTVSAVLYVILASAYVATLIFFSQARKRGAAKLPHNLD